ncbi:hypothetical protein CTAYLR_004443 [Chrysophaeum taylorii]|uniref:Calmodulin n=1 Tax=Chrysophaeum taylorii TaxID=2483200 RepID=A0AAD7UBY4_9STRA|nr:hypothetical protein CTAYLR_004443 [Chrysophaeum taylorii]
MRRIPVRVDWWGNAVRRRRGWLSTRAWTISVADTNSTANPANTAVLFAALRLSSFSEKELRKRFAEADADGDGVLSRAELRDALKTATVGRSCSTEIESRASTATTQLLRPTEDAISFEQFQKRMVELASQRDSRIWPIAGTMLLGGLSVGAIMPVMPILVHELELSSYDYGLVVSSFGGFKLVSNVPAATFVDRYGRRASIVGGLSLVSLGFAGIGMADGVLGLAAARGLTGCGVAFLVTGSTLAATDISTPLNRASTTAPLGAAFNAGTVAGPALGGALAGSLGCSSTFFVVASMMAANAFYASAFVSETRNRFKSSSSSSSGSGGGGDETRTRGLALLEDPALLRLSLSNMSYWFVVAGINMTVLPLTLADASGLALAPSQIGALFAAQAVVGVAGAMPVAKLADRIGPERLIAPAFTVVGCANAAFAFAHTYEHVAAVMIASATGASLLGSAPTAAVANAVSPDRRPQALALLRTAGDTGMLLGSASLGTVAALAGHDAAFATASALLFTSSAGFAGSSSIQAAAKLAAKPASSS